jgi:hypothetical protein
VVALKDIAPSLYRVANISISLSPASQGLVVVKQSQDQYEQKEGKQAVAISANLTDKQVQSHMLSAGIVTRAVVNPDGSNITGTTVLSTGSTGLTLMDLLSQSIIESTSKLGQPALKIGQP